jgi:hypothetical protein
MLNGCLTEYHYAFLSNSIECGMQVAETISNMVTFEGGANQPQIALAAALFSIVVWSVGV